VEVKAETHPRKMIRGFPIQTKAIDKVREEESDRMQREGRNPNPRFLLTNQKIKAKKRRPSPEGRPPFMYLGSNV
jgi:hypothetical protein